MTIYDRVLALIKEQNLTVKQVERECDLANATIRRWATQTPNVESVRRVAHRLSVTLDTWWREVAQTQPPARAMVSDCLRWRAT